MFGNRFAAGDKRRTHPFRRGYCAKQHPWLGEIHDIGPARRRFYFDIVLSNDRVGIIISINLPLNLRTVHIKFWSVSLGRQVSPGKIGKLLFSKPNMFCKKKNRQGLTFSSHFRQRFHGTEKCSSCHKPCRSKTLSERECTGFTLSRK